MEHCAIDLGGRKSQVCIRAGDGSIVHESRQDTVELREFLSRGPKSRVAVESQLVAIDALSTEIAKADRHIQACAEANPVCIRLMTVPGVGPQIALRFVAAADEIGRFRDAHRLESYFGLVPGEKSSSDMQQRLSITKAGSTAMRWLLVQAAWSVRVRCRSEHARPLQCWALEIEKRRGKRIATVALARKLAGILFSIWRDGTTYDCTRVSTMR